MKRWIISIIVVCGLGVYTLFISLYLLSSTDDVFEYYDSDSTVSGDSITIKDTYSNSYDFPKGYYVLHLGDLEVKNIDLDFYDFFDEDIYGDSIEIFNFENLGDYASISGDVYFPVIGDDEIDISSSNSGEVKYEKIDELPKFDPLNPFKYSGFSTYEGDTITIGELSTNNDIKIITFDESKIITYLIDEKMYQESSGKQYVEKELESTENLKLLDNTYVLTNGGAYE